MNVYFFVSVSLGATSQSLFGRKVALSSQIKAFENVSLSIGSNGGHDRQRERQQATRVEQKRFGIADADLVDRGSDGEGLVLTCAGLVEFDGQPGKFEMVEREGRWLILGRSRLRGGVRGRRGRGQEGKAERAQGAVVEPFHVQPRLADLDVADLQAVVEGDLRGLQAREREQRPFAVAQLDIVESDADGPIAAPPGVPADRIAALRAAFEATMKDPALVAEAAKEGLDITIVAGVEIEKLAADLMSSPPELIEKLNRLSQRQ